MKAMKNLVAVAFLLVLTVAIATSCKKDENKRPDGFGIQGKWSSTLGTGGKTFVFGTLPNLTYSFSEGTNGEEGGYEYNPTTDKLVLRANLDGAPVQNYTVQWAADFKSFMLIGGTKFTGVTFLKVE